jgi:hypothetical protein
MYNIRSFIKSFILFAFLCGLSVAGHQAYAATVISDPGVKEQIVSQANARYYSLTGKGGEMFQCHLTPDWHEIISGQLNIAPDVEARVIGVLNQIQFTLALAADGKMSLSHTDAQADNPEQANGLQQIYGGMEQMVSGFFGTWQMLMVTTPFPKQGSDYTLTAEPDAYSIDYRDSDVHTVLKMDKAYVISSVDMVTSAYKSRLEPQFSASPSGLVLTGYHATYDSGAEAEATDLTVHINNQSIGNAVLPGDMHLEGSYGGHAFAVTVRFSDCQVAR